MDRMSAMIAFVRVVEAGSFSEAARRLGSSKSSVSKHVTQLEDRLGAQLLHRTTRRLALTEAGRVFHERCARLVREIEEAELAVSQTHAEPRGRLRVNAPMSFGQLRLAPALAVFLARHPELQVELVLDDRCVDAIEGGFDVTIRIADAMQDSVLIAKRIAPVRIAVCGAPEYLARRGAPVAPADLAVHDCLVYAQRDAWRFSGPDGVSWITVAGRLCANNGDALREAALAGLGLAQLPSFIVERELASGALEPVLVPYEDPGAAVWALYSPTRHLSAKVRAFVDFLAERFRNTRADETPRSGARAAS